jgi:endonuclease YncB( thermonuclease family)
MLAEIVAAGLTFSCTPIRVWDGDGPIWCAEGPRIRLAGIAAREADGTCRPNQPCPHASAEEARDQLVRLLGRSVGRSSEGHVLVRGARLTCRSDGGADGARTAAWCVTAGGIELNCAMVASGTALRWERYWKDHRC